MSFTISCNRYLGEITIDDFTERFQLMAGFWTPNDYRKCWRSELEFLLAGRRTCCLTTWMCSPGSNEFYRGWVLQRYEDGLVLYERMWNPKRHHCKLRSDGSIQVCYAKLGDEVSKWDVRLKDIQEYINRG